MSSERYNQIIDESYSNYGKSHTTFRDGFAFVTPMEHSKETFVNECKTNPKFSNKWGLKIEERELSLEERQKLYEGEFTPGIKVINDHWLNSKLTTRNIPTKLITLTYNNETIEIYE